MKTAIVHDWLTGMRGGERVLEVLLDIFPDADLYTLFCFPDKLSEKIRKFPSISVSNLQYLLIMNRWYRYYLPFYQAAVESFDLSSYDLVISSSHAIAKNAIPGKDSVSVCYCHTPMRYVWDQFNSYIEGIEKRGNGGIRYLRHAMVMAASYYRSIDKESASRVHYYLANSRFVADRIMKYYNLPAQVIYPPIDTTLYLPGNKDPEDYYLCVGAPVPYKRLDIAVNAFKEMNKKLVIAGRIPRSRFFENLRGSPIEIVRDPTDQQVISLYQQCRALVFPGVEDFGLTPIEAQACGRPVIAYADGGVRESVIEGISGHFFPEQTTRGLIDAVREFETMTFDPRVIRQRSLQYDTKVFMTRLTAQFRDIFQKHGII